MPPFPLPFNQQSAEYTKHDSLRMIVIQQLASAKYGKSDEMDICVANNSTFRRHDEVCTCMRCTDRLSKLAPLGCTGYNRQDHPVRLPAKSLIRLASPQ
jgi:hypothetical protein